MKKFKKKKVSKAIKEIVYVIRNTDPKLVIMPILMIIFGLIATFVPWYPSETIKISVYAFITLLFFFIPTTTIGFVLKKFKYDSKRKLNLLKRMLITSVPAIFLIIMFFTSTRDIIISIYGAIGTIYFIFDYVKQGRFSITLVNKPYLTLKDQHDFEEIMETKCSRSVLYEYMRRIKSREEKDQLKQRMRETGYRFYHLHPTSERSLTQRLFSRQKLTKAQKVKARTSSVS